MRRFAAVLVAVLLIAALAIPAAASSATSIKTTAVVSTDGTCQRPERQGQRHLRFHLFRRRRGAGGHLPSCQGHDR